MEFTRAIREVIKLDHAKLQSGYAFCS